MSPQQEYQSKLNKLLSDWPKGSVLTGTQLKERGFSKQLLDKYKSSHWIAQVGKGAYKLYHDEIDWMGGIYGLQNSGYAVHVGGKTALELQGFAHYLSQKVQRIFLFGPSGLRILKWFMNYDWGLDVLYRATNMFDEKDKLGLTEYSHKEFEIRIASPERAAFKMMYHIPAKQGFDEAFRILENLTTLRSDLVQELLEKNYSFKVKRLFMYMAEKVNHAWVEELHTDRVDFGSGKRVIVPNGVLDKKYQITVEPENPF